MIAAVLLLPAKILLLLIVLLQLLLLHPVVVHLLLQASKQPVLAYDEIKENSNLVLSPCWKHLPRCFRRSLQKFVFRK